MIQQAIFFFKKKKERKMSECGDIKAFSQNNTKDFSINCLNKCGARLLTFKFPGRYCLVDQHPFVIELSIVLQIS